MSKTAGNKEPREIGAGNEAEDLPSQPTSCYSSHRGEFKSPLLVAASSLYEMGCEMHVYSQLQGG